MAYYSASAGFEVVAEVSGLLGWVNVALGAFNLLPGAPLDGGRILRSAVWAVTGCRCRAIRVAARSSQVIGHLIAGLGLLQLFFVTGALIGGLWLMFIGWFLAMAAQSEVVQHEEQEQLQGLTVGELLQDHALPTVEAESDLAAASEQLRRQSEDALVIIDGGRTTGVLLLGDVSGGPPHVRKLLLAVAILVVAWAAVVVPVPLVVLGPGQALPVSTIVDVEEGLEHDLPAEVHVIAVQLQQPTAVGAVRAFFDEHRELTFIQAVAPPGIDEERFVEFQQRLFRESVRAAVAMGLDAAGVDVRVSGKGAWVLATIPGGPADGVLRQEDVITAVDDRPVALASELAALLSEGDLGQEVTLLFQREGEEHAETLELTPLADGPQPGQIGISLLASTVELQFDVAGAAQPNEDARVGGPSAGLMLALGTDAPACGVQLADTRGIAGSGIIDPSGNVGSVDDIATKVRGAEQAGAEVFVVPETLAGEARAAANSLEMIAVGSLQEAVVDLT